MRLRGALFDPTGCAQAAIGLEVLGLFAVYTTTTTAALTTLGRACVVILTVWGQFVGLAETVCAQRYGRYKTPGHTHGY